MNTGQTHTQVYLSEVSVCTVGKQCLVDSIRINAAGELFFDEALLQVPQTRTVCDCFPVEHGTGEETLAIWDKGFSHLGVSNVAARAASGSAVHIYAFSLDNGPDHQRAGRLFRERMAGDPRSCTVVVWCFTHQYHLAVKAYLKGLHR